MFSIGGPGQDTRWLSMHPRSRGGWTREFKGFCGHIPPTDPVHVANYSEISAVWRPGDHRNHRPVVARALHEIGRHLSACVSIPNAHLPPGTIAGARISYGNEAPIW